MLCPKPRIGGGSSIAVGLVLAWGLAAEAQTGPCAGDWTEIAISGPPARRGPAMCTTLSVAKWFSSEVV